MRSYRCVTLSGVANVEPSGEPENRYAPSGHSMPSEAARREHRSMCSRRTSTVSASRAIRRCWWVLRSPSAHPRSRVAPNRAPKPERLSPFGEVDGVPAERAQLAAPDACGHGDPHERAPVGIAPRGGDDPGGLGGRRRLRVGLRCRRRLRLGDGILGDPSPSDGPLVGAGEDEVDVADRRRRERSALVRAAPVVALVRAGDAMVGRALASGATAAAAAQRRVERVQRLGVEPAGLEVAQARRDVVADVGPVQVQRAGRAREAVQVPLEQLVDGRVRSRGATLGDLLDEPSADGSPPRPALGGRREPPR